MFVGVPSALATLRSLAAAQPGLKAAARARLTRSGRRARRAPVGYADAFVRLGAAGILAEPQARRLAAAAGFRNVVARAYEAIDLARVHAAATNGPADLRAFLAAIRDLSSSRS